MQLHGYHTIEEIAEAFNVSVSFIQKALSEDLTDRQLTLFGEDNYLSSDIERWALHHADEIRYEQKLLRDLKSEIAPIRPNGLMFDDDTKGCLHRRPPE